MMQTAKFKTLAWHDDGLTLLDQTQLPLKVEYIECRDWQRVAQAIRRLEVRGAPAIGVAAAFAMVLGAKSLKNQTEKFDDKLHEIAIELKSTRPTAVNLFWAIDKMMSVARGNSGLSVEEKLMKLEAEALKIERDDVEVNKKIAEYGATLFSKPDMMVLTHCNAGSLATAGIGTALGVIRAAWQQGKIAGVFADETRPLLQGARLTVWELMQDNIPVTLITDNMAAWVMQTKNVGAIVVGADRIAANGDVANKIGTYGLAVLAREHGIPFYVAAPVSTFDFNIESGLEIKIEERGAEEVAYFGGARTAPDNVNVFNPAFDVTPERLVTGIITEFGIIRAPYEEKILKLKNERR